MVDIIESRIGRAVGAAEGIALYLHIPFCRTKCPYCDFNTYAGIMPLLPAYLEALQTEVSLWGRGLGAPEVVSVFLGGGTPSLLQPSQMDRLLGAIREAFRLREDAEVTAEVNPDDVTVARMQGFLSSGINRVSMGVQSLDRDLLEVLGRRHDDRGAVQAFRALREAGCSDVNVDLMYGLPHQTLEQWESTLQGVLDLGPDHVSAYCLTLEEGTPMERRVRLGLLPEPDPDLAAEMYASAEERLGSAGYVCYEISNWARPGHECRHNLVYWRNQPYLGVGPGAHSYLGGHRFRVVDSPAEYIARVRSWREAAQHGPLSLDAGSLERIPQVAEVEAISQSLEMAETAMLTLRLREGLALSAFQDRFGQDFRQVFGDVVAETTELGLLEVVGSEGEESARLTTRGRLLGNQVFWRFLSNLS